MSSQLEKMIIPDQISTDGFEATPLRYDAKKETSFIKPVSINNETCKIVLSKKGFLHPDSKLVLQNKVGNATNSKHLSVGGINSGIASLISSVSLNFGSKELIRVDNFTELFTNQHSAYTSGDTKRYRDSYIYLTNDAFEMGVDANVADEIKVDVDTSRTHTRIAQNEVEGSNGGIPFKVLFGSCFPDILLPLYVIQDEVSINIIWKNEASLGDRVTRIDGTYDGTNLNNPIAEDNVMFIADYIYYSPMRMEQLKQTYLNYSVSYNSIQSGRNTLPSNVAEDRVEYNLGGEGRVVHSVIFSTPNTDSTLDEVQFQLGKYGSSSNLNLGYNLIINNTPIFDTDAKSCNNADLFNRLSSVMSYDYPNIPKTCYDELQNGLSGDNFNTKPMTEMKGKMCYNAVKLGDVKVRNTPIILDLYRRDGGNFPVQDLVYFLVCKKVMTIDENGYVNISY